MKKLFVLAAATFIICSAFAYDGGKDRKCGKNNACCKKADDKKMAKTVTSTILKTTVKPAIKRA